VDWSAIGRSALMPGWGNRHLDRNYSGWAYTGIFLSSVAFSSYEFNRAIQARARFNEKSLRNDLLTVALARSIGQDALIVQSLVLNVDANQDLVAFRRSALNAIGAAQVFLATYAISLIHVSYLATSWPDPENPDASAQLLLHPGPTGDSLQFSVMVRW
jgi:hypothetical protein